MLLSCGVAAADPGGQSRSTFVPRGDSPPAAGLAAPVLPAQAKADAQPPAKRDGKFPGDRPLGTKPGQQDQYEAYIRLEPPGRERLFGSLDTERQLEERMRQERRDIGDVQDQIQFPPKPELVGQAYEPRKFAPSVCYAEPDYVVYRRLYFEEKNSERYGWELGYLQPAVSTLYFFKDVALLPHNIATYPCRRFETNAGQCLPGDPVPYRWYPPEITWTGLLAEAGAIGLIAVAVP